ncbi:hypothetical protein L541_1611 [Bordetella hinzii CA90 BAL1384]|jgi:hypothetical protein|uniref:Uncharacterized protein n=1 Tax=Bordetella hinzii OH87 BAL007II TaxID=1331262 RepID=A0ABR4QVN4_9BORD|nr:hypothetical protein L544_1257 [Bordetella hinzii OH87 BAL007II]KCB27398.1 hypothetical protein L541_1611 [Bordetella hinzii CA90 BAL1384]KCB33238.1 hypothetical protein L543_1065 [Bordetella hinzii L60]KCB43872.1 hypothetical protein L539_1510 [Bordetella hinzii 5132]KCB49809.1 hypothetical protein L538_1284 [Bordetella hinzii 4161]KCB50235.1 hypothetical protein L537_1525 [Bordetella hinzii 1277]
MWRAGIDLDWRGSCEGIMQGPIRGNAIQRPAGLLKSCA